MFAAATLGYNFSLVSGGFILNGNASGLPRASQRIYMDVPPTSTGSRPRAWIASTARSASA